MHQIATPSEKLAGRLLLLSYLLLGAVSLLVWKPHFEESFSQWKLIMGLSESYTYNYHHFNDLFLLQEIYEWLYKVNANLPWFPLSLWGFSYAASGVLVGVLWKAGRAKHVPQALHFFICLCALVLLSCNWLWIHHNRAAFLLVAAGYILPAYYFMFHAGTSFVFRWSVVSFFLTAIGTLMRPEAGIAMAVLLFPSLLVIVILNKTQWYVLLPVALPALMVTACFFYQSSTSTEFRWQLEPDVEYELKDRCNLKPLPVGYTFADSIRRDAVAGKWMLGDVALNNSTYLRGLISKPATPIHRYLFFLFPVNTPTSEHSFAGKFGAFVAAYPLYFTIVCLLLLTTNGRMWRATHLHLWLFVAAVLLLLAASFTVNEYKRVTEPILAIAFCWSVFLWFINKPLTANNNGKVRKITTTALMALLLFYTTSIFAANTRMAFSEKRAETQIQQRLNKVLATNPHKKWIITAANYTAYKTPALQPFTGFGNKTLLIPEIGQYSANPAFLQTIANLTGCQPTDFKCRMQFIDAHKSETIIIATEKRLHLYETYMQAVYGVQLNWSSAPRIHLADDTYFWLP